MNKWYLSSDGSKELSATIKGFFSLGVISAIVAGLNLVGVVVDVSDINALLDSATGIVVGIGTLGGSLLTAYGLIRKLYNRALGLGVYS